MKQLIGFVFIVAVVFGGFTIHGGSVSAIFKPSEIIIIFGAGFGGLIISSSTQTLKLMLRQIKQCLVKSPYDKEYFNQLMGLNYDLIKAHKLGNNKALDQHIENTESSEIFNKYPLILKDALVKDFIVDSYRAVMLANGKMSAHDFEAQIEEEILCLEEELETPSQRLHATAESLPGIGILAAVMGIILAMGGLDAGVAQIGSNIASALVGTFTGIFGCYCMFGPLAGAIEGVAKEQTTPLQCVKSIVFAFTQGHSAEFCANAARKHINSKDKPKFDELSDNLRGSETEAEV